MPLAEHQIYSASACLGCLCTLGIIAAIEECPAWLHNRIRTDSWILNNREAYSDLAIPVAMPVAQIDVGGSPKFLGLTN